MNAQPPKEIRPPLPRGPFLVVGLGRSGRAAARLLASRGERVRAVDSGHPQGAEGLSGLGVEVFTDTDGLAQLEVTKTVVKSPGVPRGSAAITAAHKRGIDVVGELELAWRMLPNRFLAVTGTNGKTTTAELLGHVYRSAGESVAVAGDLEKPLSGLVDGIDPEATVVCECSSLELEDTSYFAPECAVHLNLAPDHPERHGDQAAYGAAKLRIFANQGNDDVAVYNADEPELAGTDLGGCARRIAFGHGSGPDREVELDGETIFYDGEPLLEASELGLIGEHNVSNAMAAAAAALAMGIDRDAVREGLRSFRGLPHRLEQVAAVDGVRYVDDSAATSVGAAIAGLRSFAPPVHAILGGREGGESFAPLLAPAIEHCAACYLIGESAERMSLELEPATVAEVALIHCADLEDAFHRATAAAVAGAPGAVVLLSPACAASGDDEERGERFRRLVTGLL